MDNVQAAKSRLNSRRLVLRQQSEVNALLTHTLNPSGQFIIDAGVGSVQE